MRLRNFDVDYTRHKDGGIFRKRRCRACDRPLITVEKPLGARPEIPEA